MNTIFKYIDVYYWVYWVTRQGASDEIKINDLGGHLQGHFQGQM